MEQNVLDVIVGRCNLDFQGRVSLRGRLPYYGGWGSGHVSLVRQRQYAPERASEGHGGDASNDIDCRGRRP